jgi:hypothetical protein
MAPLAPPRFREIFAARTGRPALAKPSIPRAADTPDRRAFEAVRVA